MNHGGIKRTIYTPCGKAFVGSLREANGKLALHKKYCETCKDTPNPTTVAHVGGNDMNGVSFSRRGNLSKQTDKSVFALTHNFSDVITVKGVTTPELAYQAIYNTTHKV